MKKIFLPILFFLLIADTTFSLDTVSTKYLPLKVGNVWVYNWFFCGYYYGQTRLIINGSINQNGHTFYIFNQTGTFCTQCPSSSYSPFLVPLLPMRIDSVNGNIMLKEGSAECSWYLNEKILDSLRISVISTCSQYPPNNCNFTLLYDTTSTLYFGTLRKTKNIGVGYAQPGFNRTYAKDIGLVGSYKGCQFGYSCSYILIGCVLNGVVFGDTIMTGFKSLSKEIPTSFSLFQNYPNPFNPATIIKFSIPHANGIGEGQGVRLIIYDLLGREVATLVNESLKPGTYEIEWDGSNFPSGVYFYKLQSETFTETKRMVLIK